jgi:orotate phosphoribosyltransferase
MAAKKHLEEVTLHRLSEAFNMLASIHMGAVCVAYVVSHQMEAL